MSTDRDGEELSSYHAGTHSLQFRPGSFDHFVIEEVWKGGEYFLDRLVGSAPGWIIDIGAHIGAFAVKAHDTFPGQPILALEPEPENFRLLEHNLARNACSGVVALNVAVTGEGGAATLHLDPINTAGHSTVVNKDHLTFAVEAVRLDELLGRFNVNSVGLLKIDCEGAEFEILAPSRFRPISPMIQNVVFEYHPVEGHDFVELRRTIESEGFACTAHKDGYLPGQGTALFQRTQA